MAHTKKIVIHDNGGGDAPTGAPAEQIVNAPVVAPVPLPQAEKTAEKKSDSK